MVISVNPNAFTPGSIVIYRTLPDHSMIEGSETINLTGAVPSPHSNLNGSILQLFPSKNHAISLFNKVTQDFPFCLSVWFDDYDDFLWPYGLKEVVKDLEMEDINIALYRTSKEEIDAIGISSYNVPNHGELAYAGLQGMITPLLQIAINNDLGHPICANLREGKWMINYVTERLER
jgi:hypothetical protein